MISYTVEQYVIFFTAEFINKYLNKFELIILDSTIFY